MMAFQYSSKRAYKNTDLMAIVVQSTKAFLKTGVIS